MRTAGADLAGATRTTLFGFPADSFTSIFATARILGWIAHAREQETGSRLIRPRSRYVGPAPKQAA